MSGGKQTPRQKMIGMMYLVLTALLALNVSKEVLDAFLLVDEGLKETKANFQTQNEITYAAFESALKNNPEKTGPYRDKALKAKEISEKLIVHIEELKEYTVGLAGGWDEDILEETGRKIPVSKDDLDKGGQVMDVEGKGKVLQDMVNKARADFLALVENEKDRAAVEKLITLRAENPPPDPEEGNISWAQATFVHIPLAAFITQLTKVQVDIKNAEGTITNYLFKAIDAGDFKFDKLEAKVIAPTSYILLGQEYKADVFLSAFSSTQNPEIIIGKLDESGKLIGEGQKLDSVINGVGKYNIKPVSEGINKWGGIIKIKNPQGEVEEYNFQSEFQSAKPSASVSPDKMNVFYIAVDNPITVSAPGFPKDKISAAITEGSLSGGKGAYMVRVTKVGKVMVSVLAEEGKGNKRKMGEFEFRVKKVPDPVAEVAKMSGGTVSKEVMGVQPLLAAVLKDFDFDVKYTVTAYNCTYLPKRGDPKIFTDQKGALFSSDVKKVLGELKGGDRIVFEEIFASIPGDKPRKLNSIMFNIK